MASPSPAPAAGARLSQYRPTLDRLLFGVALLGVLVTVHLGIQQGRGFDRGCLGFSSPEAAAEQTFDCSAVVSSSAGTFLGTSNATWGLIFYSVVAALSLAVVFSKGGRLRAVKWARAGLITFGLLFSLRLTYLQFTSLSALCALCLISAALSATLFALLAADFFTTPSRSSDSPMSTRRPIRREATLFAALAAVLFVLIGADLLYFGSLDPSSAELTGRAATADAAAGGTATPAVAVADTVAVAEGCYFDPEKEPVENPQRLIGMMDPMEGNADAPVTVVEFFDPNCPACAQFHPVMKQLMAEHSEEARFVYKPMPLWRYSVPQIEALYAAEQEGKFTEMLEAQFAQLAGHGGGGLSPQQLGQIAQQIGMDPSVLASRLQQGTHRARTLQQRQLAAEIGVDSTPTVLVNGRFVARESRTPRCLSAFIEAGQDPDQATVAPAPGASSGSADGESSE